MKKVQMLLKLSMVLAISLMCGGCGDQANLSSTMSTSKTDETAGITEGSTKSTVESFTDVTVLNVDELTANYWYDEVDLSNLPIVQAYDAGKNYLVQFSAITSCGNEAAPELHQSAFVMKGIPIEKECEFVSRSYSAGMMEVMAAATANFTTSTESEPMCMDMLEVEIAWAEITETGLGNTYSIVCRDKSEDCFTIACSGVQAGRFVAARYEALYGDLEGMLVGSISRSFAENAHGGMITLSQEKAINMIEDQFNFAEVETCFVPEDCGGAVSLEDSQLLEDWSN